MKWYTILLIITLMIPLVTSLEECQRVVEPDDVPCAAITLWQYPNDCSTYMVNLFNQSGVLLEQVNLTTYGSTGFCQFNFTHETKGTYVYNITSGDSGIVVVEVKNMIMALIIGIAVICGILLWFAHMLNDEHIFLKIIIIVGCISMLTIIPSAFIINDATIVLHKAYMRLLTIFSIYILVFLIYKLLIKLGAIVPGENKNNG